MSGCVEQQYSCSDEAGAREGTGDTHTPAVHSPRTMAKGSGGPWPAANTTGKAICGTEWRESFGNWPNKARKQLTGRHESRPQKT